MRSRWTIGPGPGTKRQAASARLEYIANGRPVDGSTRHQPKTSQDPTDPLALHVGAIAFEVDVPHPASAWWSRGFACTKPPRLRGTRGAVRRAARANGEMRG